MKNDVKFALISIGMPDTGIKLCNHLGIENGEEWIFADPENSAYDQLRLNKGWNTMISPGRHFGLEIGSLVVAREVHWIG